jgi:hypothetical protein
MENVSQLRFEGSASIVADGRAGTEELRQFPSVRLGQVVLALIPDVVILRLLRRI